MKSIVFLVIIFITNFLFAQLKNADNIKILEQYLIIDSTKSQQISISLIKNPPEKFLKFKVDVIDLTSLDTLQTFNDSYTTGQNLEYAFKLEDVNFDNYKDLMVLTNIGNSGNKNYDFWIYKPIEKKYVFDEKLTSILASNPYIDSDSKTYQTGGFLGCASMCWSYSTYKYIKNNLVKVSEETQERIDSLDDKTGQYIFRRYKKTMQGDSLVIVKDITGIIMYIERNWDK